MKTITVSDSTRQSKKSKYVKVALVTVMFFSLTINIGLFSILFTPLNEWAHKLVLVNKDIPDNADVVIICSSNFPFDTETGLPDLSTLVRMEKGLRVYREGIADKIIAFGGIWMPNSKMTTGQAIKERLLLYGIPEEDIIVQDQVRGKLNYYENLLDMMEKHKVEFDFNRAIFVTSADQSYRLNKCLESEIKNPLVITGEPYEFSEDWGRRFHIFRRVANEIVFGIPYFYLTDRFSNPSTFVWDKSKGRSHDEDKELYEIFLSGK
ncbi:MAG: YdcF family protein [Candidatus Brocadiaceae bacterium]|nr:YdcF family protein [Candidatus Brocadiaceae bacterium]